MSEGPTGALDFNELYEPPTDLVVMRVSPDAARILLSIYNRLGQPETTELDEADRMSLALDVLCNSYDTANSAAEQGEESKPYSAEEIAAALANVNSPDISTDFAPPLGAGAGGKVFTTFEALLEMHPNVTILKEAADITLPEVAREAAEVVLNNFPQSEWESDNCKKMYAQTLTLMRNRINFESNSEKSG